MAHIDQCVVCERPETNPFTTAEEINGKIVAVCSGCLKNIKKKQLKG